jgi:hypothetical protein
MFGTQVTYVLGSEASSNFWTSSNDHLNAEDLYKNITVPVFGKGVAFDVPNKVFSQQKQMAGDSSHASSLRVSSSHASSLRVSSSHASSLCVSASHVCAAEIAACLKQV